MISTVLLLICLGILIFHLTNPNYFIDGFGNTTGSTTDTNNNRGGNNGRVNAGSGNAGSGNAGSGNAGSGNAVSGNAGSGNAGSGNAGSGNAVSGNDVSGNDVSGNDVSGSGGTVMHTPKLWTDPGRTHLNTVGDTNNHLLNDNPLFSFTGNIDSSDMTGADLNTAFEPPSGNSNTADVIDFNKNNLEKYNVKDYLPKDVNKDWFNTDFSQAQHNIDDTNLINPDRFIIGINTVGQSLKSPSWDIRGSPPCPKYAISPWNNSTFEPDYNIKPLC